MNGATDERYPRVHAPVVWIMRNVATTGHSCFGVLASMLAWAQLLVPDQAASVPLIVWALLLPGDVLPAISLLLCAAGWIGWNVGPHAAAPAVPT